MIIIPSMMNVHPPWRLGAAALEAVDVARALCLAAAAALESGFAEGQCHDPGGHPVS